MKKVNDLKGRTDLPEHKAAYTTWNNMHKRISRVTYKHVEIVDEWYTFSNFYNWYVNAFKLDGWQLDKDLLSGVLYSPETCIFVPLEVNMLFRNVSTSIAKGVVMNKNNYQSQITINGEHIKLGTYSDIESASAAYWMARKNRCKELSTAYSNYTKLSEGLYKHSL